MADTVELVTHLVLLRRWAFRQLAPPDGGQRDAAAGIPDVPPNSWDFFLKLERCASPLLHSLTSAGKFAPIDAKVKGVIDSAAIRETRRVLAAEREARELGAIAERSGNSFIVLKGGVRAVVDDSTPLDIYDIDLLVEPAAIPGVERALAAAQFVRAEHNEAHHTYWEPPIGRVPVEVHWTTNSDGTSVAPGVWSRVTPLGLIGLSRLDHADQILHLLRHALDQHNERHVSIRDLLLIEWFCARLTEGEWMRLRDEIEMSSDPERYRQLLDFARGIAAGTSVTDPFEDKAILHFAAAALTSRGELWRGGPALAWSRAAAVAAREITLRELASAAYKSPVTGIGAFATMQERMPQAGAIVTKLARTGHYMASASIGAPVLLAIRREVQERLNAHVNAP